MNPLYPALKRLPFSGFQSSLIADRRGNAIRPAVETLQKANRSCGRARMSISKWTTGSPNIYQQIHINPDLLRSYIPSCC
ncbi:MAG: hypothetical protein JRI35_01825 [Deltaproteobacteria bacterium]|nr:hypothetical protein [Deltaproteobacteria bacterium]